MCHNGGVYNGIMGVCIGVSHWFNEFVMLHCMNILKTTGILKRHLTKHGFLSLKLVVILSRADGGKE